MTGWVASCNITRLLSLKWVPFSREKSYPESKSYAWIWDQKDRTGPYSASCGALATALPTFDMKNNEAKPPESYLARYSISVYVHAQPISWFINFDGRNEWQADSSLGSLHPLVYHGCSYIFYSLSFSMSKQRPYSSTVRIHPRTPMYNYHELYLESSGVVCPP